MNIRSKVALSFTLVTAILIMVILVIIQQVRVIESTTKQVINLRTPTAQASLSMLNGMNHSLASLRGWIILGEDEFKVERGMAWSQQIEPSYKRLKELSSEWTDPDNVVLLDAVAKDLDQFKSYQKKIEDIAHTDENTPARKILFEQVEPLDEMIITGITKMIKMELKVKRTPERGKLVSLMVDFEAITGLALEKMEEYLLSGDDVFKVQFQNYWSRNNQLYMELQSKKGLLTPSQKKTFDRLSSAQDKLHPLFQKMVTIRSSEEWNHSSHLLKTKAAPLAASINQRLNEMITSQNLLLKEDLAKVSERTHFLIVILVGWLFAGGLISGVLGATITRGISVPLQNVSRVVRGLSSGDFRQDSLETITKDELGNLVRASNQLVSKLKSFKRYAIGILSGNVHSGDFDVEGDYKKILEGMRDMIEKKEK
jgi:methyl-accepting chemotaxis protein